MAWQLQSAQCSVFPADQALNVSAFEIWARLAGTEPENYQRQPPATVAIGPYEGAALNVSVQPGRLDCILQPTGDAVAGPPVLDHSDRAIELVKALGQVLAREYNPVRVSLVANCIRMTESYAEAVRLFSQEAHQAELPLDASDLNFQLNIRRRLNDAGWEMNRVVRWGTAQFQQVTFTFGPTGVPTQQVVSAQDGVALVVDVNSMPRGALPLGGKQGADALDSLEHQVKALISGGYDALVS